MYLKFFLNQSIKPKQDGFYFSHLAFTRINAKLRYPLGAKRSHEDEYPSEGDWTYNNNIPHEFMQYYNGVLTDLQQIRNFAIILYD